MKIVLFQPQIPQNTGNIARTSAVTGSSLILIRPLGFSTHSRHLKRAGLDYWEEADVKEADDLPSLLEKDAWFFFFSSKTSRVYTTAPYRDDSLLIFGSETTGLPPYFFNQWPDRFYKIPMVEDVRCLNLASSVAVVLYEALRQTRYFERPINVKRMLAKADVVSGT